MILNKNIKRLLIIFLSLIFFLSNYSLAIVGPTSSFYVNDSAGIISSSLESYIIDIGTKLYNQTGAQIVVVTVNSLEGMEISDYATTLGRSWGVGSSSKNNGIVFLVAVQERELYIEVRLWIRRHSY